jgi:hypothetical protein
LAFPRSFQLIWLRWTIELSSLLGYSIFGIAVDRNLALKWLFPYEKATFNALKKATLIPKML